MESKFTNSILIDQVGETMKLRSEAQEIILGLEEISRQLDELISLRKAELKPQQQTQ